MRMEVLMHILRVSCFVLLGIPRTLQSTVKLFHILQSRFHCVLVVHDLTQCKNILAARARCMERWRGSSDINMSFWDEMMR